MIKQKKLSKNSELSWMVLSLILFTAGYLLLNYRMLVSDVLYRWAANDTRSATLNLLSYFFQGVLLVVIVSIVPRKMSVVVFILVGVSGLVNLIYQQILLNTIDVSSLEWMLGESRSFTSAFKQFIGFFALGIGKISLALLLFISARHVVRKRVLPFGDAGPKWMSSFTCMVLLILFLFIDPLLHSVGRARGAEANIYGMLARITLQEVPERRPVNALLISTPMVKKIVWLVDESVGWKYFDRYLRPDWIDNWSGIDLGEISSLANCSAQSNAALRWGVNVEKMDPLTDLRKNSTIWAYARKAGYRTFLIDGQVHGNPQNYLGPSERTMIDSVTASAAGLDTDSKIAKQINDLLRSSDKEFIYAVLKGAHYQYFSNYPNGELEKNIPIEDQYRKALLYSKKNFLQILFADIDREDVAVFYTSDHGQHIEFGTVPHCNEIPFSDEFSVPLVLYLGDLNKSKFNKKNDGKLIISQSQIFPTTLIMMGFDGEYAATEYDNPLPLNSKKLIRFGKRIMPALDGKPVDIFLRQK